MKLIVGLGNIGEIYKNTRHNIGFSVIDNLSKNFKVNNFIEKFKGFYSKNDNFILFKPSTFMNLSGIAVKEIIDFFKIKIDDVLIIFDDMSLPIGKIRLRESGSSGGHRGVQNIIDNLHTNNFKRLRIGIGKPLNCSVPDFVLGKINNNEEPTIANSLKITVDILLKFIKNTKFKLLMNEFNL